MSKKRTIMLVFLLVCAGTLGALIVYYSAQHGAHELVLESASIATVLPSSEHHGDMYENGTGLVTSPAVFAPEDMWVTSVEPTIKNGPTTLLHHMAIVRLDRPNPTCGLKYRNLPIYMTSSESPIYLSGKETFDAPYAIFIPKGAPIMIRGMLSDAEPPKGPGGVYNDVSLVVHLKYETDEKSHVPIEYNLVVLTKKDCKVSSDLPAHTVLELRGNRAGSTQNGAYTFAADGEVLAMRAHFHPWEGGKSETVSLNGKVLNVFTPYLASSEPWSWKIGRYGEKLSVKKGDVLTIDALYDNQSDKSFTDAMAMLGFYFIPGKRQ